MNGILKLLSSHVVLLLFLNVFFIINVSITAGFVDSGIVVLHFKRTRRATNITPRICFVYHAINTFLNIFFVAGVSRVGCFHLGVLTTVITILMLTFCRGRTITLIYVKKVNFFYSYVFPVVCSVTMRHVPRGSGLVSNLVVATMTNKNTIAPLVNTTASVTNVATKMYILLVYTFCLAFYTFNMGKAH